MKLLRKAQDFRVREDGSLLVFFVVSIVAILGIMALSFDMGRRASTQTDMQSFADNVALAAAGELDGRADAITRAREAAEDAIIAANETLKAGASGTAAALTFDPLTDLVFYTSLPDSDTPGSFTVANLTASKYQLPTTDVTTSGSDAAFVGVRLDTVDVDWMFGNIFGNANLPDEAVGAIAIAGNAGFTCEVAPLMVCLPEVLPPTTPTRTVQTLAEGRAIRLRSVGRNAQWNPGEFGFLDIDWLLQNDQFAAGECANETPESRRQACMLAKGLRACFNSSGVEIQPGQRSGQETAGFNLPFGIFEQAMNQLRGDDGYEIGPHAVGGREVNNSCNDRGPSPDTMAFPLDNCHYPGNPAYPCDDNRFGDGTWSTGRTQYVDTNYGFQPERRRPSDPLPPYVQGSFFDFPAGMSLTRYEYYLLEIERAARGGKMPASFTFPHNGRTVSFTDPVHTQGNDGGRGGPPGLVEHESQYTTWDDYWPDTLPASGVNPIIPAAHDKSENGGPQCAQVEQNTNADRRVVIIAGIDCINQTLTGREVDVPVVEYYRTFMLSPATEVSNDPSNGQMFDLWVEVIEPIGGDEAGASTTAGTAFRRLVQLYR